MLLTGPWATMNEIARKVVRLVSILRIPPRMETGDRLPSGVRFHQSRSSELLKLVCDNQVTRRTQVVEQTNF
jgi:hypothetical protein